MRRLLLALALLGGRSVAVQAQVVPNADWNTITTTHFRVHFTPAL